MMRGLFAQWMRRLRRERGGNAAVEFALLSPVLILMYVGSTEIGQYTYAYRKVCLTARTVADLASQYTTMAHTDEDAVIAAATQVMSPFAGSTASVVLSEIAVSSTGVATVQWSRANANSTALNHGDPFNLPTGLAVPSTYLIVSQVSYTYNPPVLGFMKSPLKLSDQAYISPRQSASITTPDG